MCIRDSHYHFHIIVDSLEAAKYVVAQWKKLHGSTVADARFQKYKKIEDFESGINKKNWW